MAVVEAVVMSEAIDAQENQQSAADVAANAAAAVQRDLDQLRADFAADDASSLHLGTFVRRGQELIGRAFDALLDVAAASEETYDAFRAAELASMYTLDDDAPGVVQDVLQLLAKPSASPEWNRTGVSAIIDLIQGVLDAFADAAREGGAAVAVAMVNLNFNGDGPVTLSHCAYLYKIASTVPDLHDNGAVPVVDDMALMHLYNCFAPETILHRRPPTATSQSVTMPVSRFCDMMLRQYHVHAEAFTDVLANNRVKLLSFNCMVMMAKLFEFHRGWLADWQSEDTTPVLVMWDGDSVPATADLIETLDKPWFHVHVYQSVGNEFQWQPLLHGRSNMTHHPVVPVANKAINYAILANLVRRRPAQYSQAVILVSTDESSTSMADELLSGNVVNCVVHVRTAQAVAVLASWCEMCLTGGSDQGKAEWRARAAAAAAAAAAEASNYWTKAGLDATALDVAMAGILIGSADLAPLTHAVLRRLAVVRVPAGPDTLRIPVHMLEVTWTNALSAMFHELVPPGSTLYDVRIYTEDPAFAHTHGLDTATPDEAKEERKGRVEHIAIIKSPQELLDDCEHAMLKDVVADKSPCPPVTVFLTNTYFFTSQNPGIEMVLYGKLVLTTQSDGGLAAVDAWLQEVRAPAV
ncbi:hypothetical protein H9P43_000272 [Blastocladiella emersonii ATCC 22665]|nr:hypothetical protein H9P43_000272 [Blastocladiella emersonii ATCC 22665]